MAQAKQISEFGAKIIVGTGSEVSRRLHRLSAHRVLAVTLTDDAESAMLEDVVRKVAEFLPHIVRQRQKESLEKIVGALLPEIVIPSAALIQARMMMDAKSKILQAGDFVSAIEIAKLAGYSEKNPRAQPNNWKKDGTIFAIQYRGVDYFPIYALDPDENYRPFKAVAEVLRVFGESRTGWGTAFWFAGLNSYLDDRRPQDLIASDSELVIAAAKDEVLGVQHG
jgi:hypothetical protein